MHPSNVYVVGEMMSEPTIYQSVGERHRSQESPPNYRAATSFAQQHKRSESSDSQLPCYAEAIEKERY